MCRSEYGLGSVALGENAVDVLTGHLDGTFDIRGIADDTQLAALLESVYVAKVDAQSFGRFFDTQHFHIFSCYAQEYTAHTCVDKHIAHVYTYLANHA